MNQASFAQRFNRPLRIIVMGTGPFAVPMFAALCRSGQKILAVVTRPDRTAAGRRPPHNPLREAAAAAGLPILDPERINDPETIAALTQLAPDLFVVCDYGQILAPAVLSLAAWGGINLHGSLLPRHRGAAPVQWAILSGDEISGVSVIHMTPTLDAGAVIVAQSTPIQPHETAVELEQRLAAMGAGAVQEAIQRLHAAACHAAEQTGEQPGEQTAEQLRVGTPQDPTHATHARRLTKADGVVDWSLSAASIERMRRALEPWPRTTTFLMRGGSQQLQRLVLEDVAVAQVGPQSVRPAVGTVLAAAESGILVACGEATALLIRQLIPEGRRSMSAAEFLCGHALPVGTLFQPSPARPTSH